MARTVLKSALACIVSFGALASAVQAGGFTRGEADTDILYETGPFSIHTGAVYVAPQRGFETISGATGTDGDFTDSYWIPSLAAKVSIGERLACAFTYTQPFGADATYGAQAQLAAARNGNTPYSSKSFDTNEYGGTCAVNFEAGKGRLHLLGGVFMQDFSYTAVSPISGTLKLEDDSAWGYRLGIGYDITEYALRVQLMYRSKVDHTADEGSFDFRNTGRILPANGYGTLPQSLKLSVQTGVAPGWLVYGSVKWTDWSVLQALNYTITGIGARQDIYNWKDGWTIQAGVGHAFTDTVSGTINLTYDTGVDSGADIATDTWTLGLGTSIKAAGGEFRLGGGITYITSGSQSLADGASYNATAGGDWSYAFGGGFNMKF